jgi:hypothetical protein
LCHRLNTSLRQGRGLVSPCCISMRARFPRKPTIIRGMTWIGERSRACVARSFSRPCDAHPAALAPGRGGAANGRSCRPCRRTLVQPLRTYRLLSRHKIVSVVPSARSSLPTVTITREIAYCSVVRDEQPPVLGDGAMMVGEDFSSLRHVHPAEAELRRKHGVQSCA